MRVRITPEYPGLVISDDGRIQGPSGKWLRAFPSRDGYLRFNVYQGAKHWKQYGVHAAVCTAFHGTRPEGMLVRHLNGNPQDNRADNLTWGTYVENEKDKKLHGTALLGEKHHQAKLSAEQVREIRKLRSEGMKLEELSRRYQVSQSLVCAIAKRKIWRHLT